MSENLHLLEPCPWCAAGTSDIKPNGRIWSGMKWSEPVSVSVQHWCEPEPGQPSRMIERTGRDEASAIAAWNRRAQPAAPSVAPEPPTREALAEIVRLHLTSTYHCTRVWEAWHVGTMTEDDFEPASESDMAEEIADAILAAHPPRAPAAKYSDLVSDGGMDPRTAAPSVAPEPWVDTTVMRKLASVLLPVSEKALTECCDEIDRLRTHPPRAPIIEHDAAPPVAPEPPRSAQLMICTGCGRQSDDEPIKPPALACCPDNRYRTLRELLSEIDTLRRTHPPRAPLTCTEALEVWAACADAGSIASTNAAVAIVRETERRHGISAAQEAATVCEGSRVRAERALAAPSVAPEPVAWMWRNKITGAKGVYFEDPERFFNIAAKDEYEWTPLFAHPPRAPLTDAEIDCLRSLDTDRRVRFYEHDFYVLSNFSAFNLEWEGMTFQTSEAAYHWEKFATEADDDTRNSVAYAIYEAPSAHEAFKIAETQKHLRRPDWDDVKVGIMRDILRAKADQHEYVRRKLLATGDRELVEDSWRDDFWGWGPNRDGQNMLGKLWMEVRAALRQGQPT